MEAAALQQQQQGLMLAEQVWLERLHSRVLPVLDEWVAQIGRVREEREDLGRHVSGEPPSLEDLHMKHDMFKKAKRFLRDKTNELENAREDGVNLAPAQKALKEARRAMQAAERALHQARFEAATLASAHFPEFGHFRGKGSLRRSSAGTFWPKCLYNSNLCSSSSCCSARTGSAGKLRVIASARASCTRMSGITDE